MHSTTEPAAERELRYAVAPITEVNFRDAAQTGDGTWLIEGYAAVSDKRTVLFDGKFGRVTEEIAPGAFTNVLARMALPPDNPRRTLVHLNYVHDMQASIAATDAPEERGRLTLSEDHVGLRFSAKVARDDIDVQRVVPKMRDGIARQASFAFTIADEDPEQRDLPDGRFEDHYRILEIADLFDVCVCPRGAYQQTISTLRSYAAAIGRSPEAEPPRLWTPGEGHPRRSVREGAIAVAPVEEGGVGQSPRLVVARAKARARLALIERTGA
ncbi:MAG: HK97 family phage prohead protease [Thermoleophilia bacterium]